MPNVGRPTVMTAETIAQLETAFANGATDNEACFVAGIGVRTLYDYCRENPEFSQRKQDLKEMLKYQAKSNIAEELRKKNLSLSQWYAERKIDEFNPKIENKNSGEVNININDSGIFIHSASGPASDNESPQEVQGDSLREEVRQDNAGDKPADTGGVI